MKFLEDKQFGKKIIIAILLVMTFNFITPTVSISADAGGALFKPIGQLLCGLGDVVIMLLQDIFLGNGQINYTVKDGITTYNIQYSPAAIFSNKIPGLDINFINPQEDYKVTVPSEWKEIKSERLSKPTKGQNDIEQQFVNEILALTAIQYGFSQEVADSQSYVKDEGDIIGLWYEDETEYKRYTWEYDKDGNGENEEYMLAITTSSPALIDAMQNVMGILGGNSANKAVIDILEGLGWKDADKVMSAIHLFSGGNLSTTYYYVTEHLIEQGAFNETKCYLYKRAPAQQTGETIESTAGILQDTIATWYVALRAVALVGLLSVLVYVGIRMLISATGESKAKYKKMLMDWIAAVCILFVLQYIMSTVLIVTEKVTEMLTPYAISEETGVGRDVLMSDIREEIFARENGDFFNIFSYVLMYITLVIFTVMFTWQYLKRVIYMAFLTLIAPLISLTYPLDKIKDGQAQAFTMWIREYIFNALLQVVHLLIYCILVGTGREMLVRGNPLFAIAAIGFLIPAEKFIRKMFGFDKANAGNVMGAAAGGAFIMNAINKMAQKGKKSSDGKGDSGNSGNSTPRYASSPKASNEGNTGNTQNANSNVYGPQPYNGQQLVGPYGETIKPAEYGTKSRWNGVKTLAGRYTGKAVKGVKRGAIGALGAATLGTVGLAAGLTTGDGEKALSYAAAGGLAGYMGANNVVDNAVATGKENLELYRQGKWGTDEYNKRNTISQLSNDKEFSRMCDKLNIKDKEELIRRFHSNGITSLDDIKKSMSISSKTGASTNEIIAAYKIRQQAKNYGMSREDIENNLKGRGVTGSNLNKAMNIIDQL